MSGTSSGGTVSSGGYVAPSPQVMIYHAKVNSDGTVAGVGRTVAVKRHGNGTPSKSSVMLCYI
jgi:hypothetical protein